MKRLAILLSLALPLCARDKAQLKHDLDQIARVATVMVDGDSVSAFLLRALSSTFFRKIRAMNGPPVITTMSTTRLLSQQRRR